MATAARGAPASPAEAAELLRAASRAGRAVAIVGGGTKPWARPPRADAELSTSDLARIVEHNERDLTAVLQAGVRLADAQARFADAGQMLALDPPLGTDARATVGGVFATADSGPLRHRYGGPRDLVLGMAVALPDGTVARSGGKVIKNVAGYDLAKLFTGSYGTLGAIGEIVVRLHPLPPVTATAVARSDDPRPLAETALALARAPLELEALDVSWADGRGAVLARFAGRTAPERARAAADAAPASTSVETDVLEDDADAWAAQRAGQRAADGVVVRVVALPERLEWVIRTAARLGARAVGRAGLGVSWLTLPVAPIDDLVAAVEELRAELTPARCVVADAPPGVRERTHAEHDDTIAALMARVRERFDPAGVCNPGVVVP